MWLDFQKFIIALFFIPSFFIMVFYYDLNYEDSFYELLGALLTINCVGLMVFGLSWADECKAWVGYSIVILAIILLSILIILRETT